MTPNRIDEKVDEFWVKFDDGKTPQMVGMMEWLRTALTEAHQAGIGEAVEKRNGVIKEYKDEGVMFILKVEDGKTYEASMPIPKWAEVGKVQLRDHSELDQDNNN